MLLTYADNGLMRRLIPWFFPAKPTTVEAPPAPNLAHERLVETAPRLWSETAARAGLHSPPARPSYLRGTGEQVKPVEGYMDPGLFGRLRRWFMAAVFALFLKGKPPAALAGRSADDKLNWANHQIDYRREPALPHYLDRRRQPWGMPRPIVLPIQV